MPGRSSATLASSGNGHIACRGGAASGRCNNSAYYRLNISAAHKGRTAGTPQFLPHLTAAAARTDCRLAPHHRGALRLLQASSCSAAPGVADMPPVCGV